MKQHTHHIIAISLLILLTLLFSACSSTNNPTSNGTGSTPIPTSPSNTGAATTPTSPPGVRLGPQSCPDKVRDPAYWNTIANVNTSFGDKVYTVTCANLMGDPSLQALVTVICECSGGFMDVHVYTNITDTPKEIFKLDHLEKGDAKISNYNTVLTDQVDELSSINKTAKGNASLVPDLYREFKWNQNTGAMVQISFPGMFPDLTRFQAENDQAQVNQGHDPWKLSPTITAQAFAAKLLKWSANAPALVKSGGGTHDANAVVEVRSTPPGNGDPITVTLNRLEGNTNGGIWIVTAASNPVEVLTQPQSGQALKSPAPIQGNGEGSNGTAGTVVVLDHLYTNIGQVVVPGTNGRSHQPINTTVSYTSSFQGGQEEGIVMLYDTLNSDGSIAHPMLVKVLLG